MPKTKFRSFISAKGEKLMIAVSPSRRKSNSAQVPQSIAGSSQGSPNLVPGPASIAIPLSVSSSLDSKASSTASSYIGVIKGHSGPHTTGLSKSPPSTSSHTPIDMSLTLGPSPSNQTTISARRPVTPSIISFTPDPALKSAIEHRAAKLSESDKKAFLSAGNILDAIQAMDQEDARTNISRSFGFQVEKVLQCINRFMGTVTVCIQHNPEISSLVVGGFNCVLRLALDYIEFFGSLTNMVERIGGHLQYLCQYGSPVFQNVPDVQNALVGAYCDLLDFFVAARGVFTDKGGKASYLKSFKLFLKLTWEPFESKFKPIEDSLSHHALVVFRLAGVHDLIMKYERLLNKDLEEKAEKRQKVLNWLTTVDFEETHQRHFKKHFPGTGQWLLENPLFSSWKNRSGSSLLWCHGIPGTGKTVLASLVIEKLSAEYELSSNTGICSLYCSYDKQQYTAETYLKVAIKQLSRRMSELPIELETLYDKHYFNASSPGLAEVQGVFTGISRYFDRVFLVLDALDEVTIDQRKELIGTLHNIISDTDTTTSSGNTKLFVTSRKEPDIERGFESFPVVEIEAKKVDVDIELYVVAQLNQYLQDGTLKIKDTLLKDKILNALLSRAEGMFLWVEFQLKEICSQFSDYSIEEALRTLPEDIDHTYERIIDLINKKPKSQRKLARRVLMWILYAERQLSLEELVYAVAMEASATGFEGLKSMIPSAKDILDSCVNLVVLVDSTKKTAGRGKVRFVHFSVKEFLLKKLHDLDNPSAVTTLDIGYSLAHTEIARICINFLLNSWGGYFGTNTTCMYRYRPFAAYAEPAWKGHVRALSKITEDLMVLILELFRFGPFLSYDKSRSRRNNSSTVSYTRADLTNFSPSTIALIFNLPLVEAHLEKQHDPQEYPEDSYAMHHAAKQNSYEAIKRLCNRFSVDQRDSDGCTPLHYAATKLIAQLLLDKGADPEALGGGRNVLYAAAHRGNKDVVQLLLDRGADVNIHGGKHWNTLHAAATSGNTEVVRLLLNKGADLNVQEGTYGDVLQAAVSKGDKEMVQLVLDKGVGLNIQGARYGNVLQAAAYKGDKEMVQFFLDRGVDMVYGDMLQAAADGNNIAVVQLLLDRVDLDVGVRVYDSALHTAAYRGNKGVVELLLDKGADISARGGRFGTAFAAAASTGNIELVQLFLDKGVDINIHGNRGTALYTSTENKKEEVVKLLLDRGADVNVRSGFYGSALQAAIHMGYDQLVELLLDQGDADVNIEGGVCGNPLQVAALRSNIHAATLLLDRGVDVNIKGGSHGSALQAAAFSGYGEMVQLLLDRGADVNIQGGGYFGNAFQSAIHGGYLDAVSRKNVFRLLLHKDSNVQRGELLNELHVAAIDGNKEVVMQQLDRGVDLNSPGVFRDALLAAALGGNEEVVLFLLDRVVDVTVQEVYGDVLLMSALHGNHAVVQSLLERGVDMNFEMGHWNALRAAARGGNREVVQLLLDSGVDVNTQDCGGGSALDLAILWDKSEMVQYLLDRGADMNAQHGSYRKDSLRDAVMGRMPRKEIVKLLLERGADANIAHGGKTTSKLAYEKDAGMAQMMLESGVVYLWQHHTRLGVKSAKKKSPVI